MSFFGDICPLPKHENELKNLNDSEDQENSSVNAAVSCVVVERDSVSLHRTFHTRRFL